MQVTPSLPLIAPDPLFLWLLCGCLGKLATQSTIKITRCTIISTKDLFWQTCKSEMREGETDGFYSRPQPRLTNTVSLCTGI